MTELLGMMTIGLIPAFLLLDWGIRGRRCGECELKSPPVPMNF